MHYSIIPTKNYDGPPTLQAKRHWKSWHGEGCKSDYAVVVKDNEKIIAFFCFRFKPLNKYLHSNGTWVSPKYRRRGIAKKMWNKAIRKFKPAVFYAAIVSRDGQSFSRHMKTTNQQPLFDFWYNK